MAPNTMAKSTCATHAWSSVIRSLQFLFAVHYLKQLFLDLEVKRWNRRFGCETIYPTPQFISMNLTWA